MRSSIRPDELAKYAPRWVREGRIKPKYGKGLPPAAQLPTADSGDPPWRGPSPFQDDAYGPEGDGPFDGDVRDWRGHPAEPQLTHQLPLPMPGSLGGQMGLVEKMFRGAAVVVFAIIAMGALSMVLFPDAPKEVAQISSQLAAISERSVSQVDKRPAKSTARLVSDERRLVTAAAVTQSAPVAITQSVPVQAATSDVETTSRGPQTLAVQQTAPEKAVVAAATAAVAQVSTVPTSGASALSPQRVHSQRILSPDELDRLIKRGETFLEQGDVAAARLVFSRAAEARDPRAALALGSTFDPNVLRKMGVVGVQPDAEQARVWYERAAAFGSDDAGPRLSALAQLNR